MKSQYWLALALTTGLVVLAIAVGPVSAVTAQAPATPSTPGPPPAPLRIQFQAGATSAIIGGSLAAGGTDHYVLGATAGQTLIVNVSATSGQASLAITGADGTPLVSNTSGTTGWDGRVLVTQDYFIDVVAGPDAPATYSLLVVIPSLAPGHVVIVGNQDAGSTVQLQVGDLLDVTLPGDAAAGNLWQTQAVDATILQQVEGTQYTQNSAGIPGGVFLLQYVAVAPGTTQLQLVYQQPSGAGNPPANTFVITVVVVPFGATPTPTATAAPAACTNLAAFVTDVTIPDGSALSPGQLFTKVWRVANTGSCTWNANYQLVFLSDDPMSAPPAVAIPDTPPGANADLVVPMVVPVVPGTYLSRWQLRADDGSLFGPVLFARINVIAPAPAVCSGTPSIPYFTASSTNINRGDSVTLSWGFVSNADRAEITPNIGGVGTPGSITVSLNDTTTFTLNAYCGGSVVSAQVTVFVQEATATPTSTAAVCTGAPVISSFTASDTAVAPGQPVTLSWAVGNANQVAITPDIGGVGLSGSTGVTLGQSTTFTLSAFCGSNVATAQVTVNVMSAAPTATSTQVPTSTPAPAPTSTPTPTETRAPAPTLTPTPTATSVSAAPTATPTPTPVPPQPTPTRVRREPTPTPVPPPPPTPERRRENQPPPPPPPPPTPVRHIENHIIAPPPTPTPVPQPPPHRGSKRRSEVIPVGDVAPTPVPEPVPTPDSGTPGN